MKTTNYEISKQLAEAGFEGETDFYWGRWDTKTKITLIHKTDTMPYLRDSHIKAYDFETILQELPRRIEVKTGMIYELRACFYRSYSEGFEERNYIGYQNFQGFHSQLLFKQEENESLADTAARLLLLLHEKNLIKF